MTKEEVEAFLDTLDPEEAYELTEKLSEKYLDILYPLMTEETKHEDIGATSLPLFFVGSQSYKEAIELWALSQPLEELQWIEPWLYSLSLKIAELKAELAFNTKSTLNDPNS